jgi:hypothetical protein
MDEYELSWMIPKRRSYDESADEPDKLIEDEPVDIEGETPAKNNEPVERSDGSDDPEAPVFEE